MQRDLVRSSPGSGRSDDRPDHACDLRDHPAAGAAHVLDFFSAERRKGGSNILFMTTLGLHPVTPN
jgi:hypothetical protein